MKMQILAVALFLLFLLNTNSDVRAECPIMCSCSERHRTVDCSWRGFRHLPLGLQRNIQSLNLTHNRLSDLDHQLSSFTHLRILDISYNRLLHFPASLPRSLWEINVSGNRLHLLNKDDTAYQWNLRVLDLSVNKLERVVFINNTLPNLQALNLSHNKFWTVPTNMPKNLEMVDLSHNTLVQILPGSLTRLTRLARFYLHANRFTMVSEGAFEHLQGLKLITLGDNPWACEEAANISHLLSWSKQTTAQVLGCPCHTWHTCGEAQTSNTGSRHFDAFTLSPFFFGTEKPSHHFVEAVTTHFWSGTSLLNTRGDQTGYRTMEEQESSLLTLTPEVLHSSSDGLTTLSTTLRTSTLRTRSVKRPNQKLNRDVSSGQTAKSELSFLFCCTFLLMAITNSL
ncbi:hypothetical protein DNTS_026122 [Danionella cerebrum]|uniref:LRRNT domain-containing protein n=1 Tax=Danionella cerebrum TaxID=2873325 RepID=A0A553QR21_9TELE|nr:hypothetical protein DNTS_026122 [Danionella translucida]